MSNYITCSTTTLLSQPGTCFVAANYNSNAGIEYTKRNKRVFIGLAITELVLGIFLIGIGITAIQLCNDTEEGGWYNYPFYTELLPPGLDHNYYPIYNDYGYKIWSYIGSNIWGGALVILFGSFCFAQACNPSRCTIGANLVLSVVGIIVSLGLMGVEIAAAYLGSETTTLIILHSIAACFYFILTILFIVSTSRAGIAHGCCKACCCEPYGQQRIISINPAGHSYVVTMSNGQTVLVPGHPHVTPAPSYAENSPQHFATTPEAPSANTGARPSDAQDTRLISPAYATDIPPKV